MQSVSEEAAHKGEAGESPSLVGILEEKLVEKEGRADEAGYEGDVELVKSHIDRVRTDLSRLPPDSYRFSPEDGGDVLGKLIGDLNVALEKEGASHRYLGIGDQIELQGKSLHVTAVVSSYEEVLGRKEFQGLQVVSGATEYDNPPRDREFLPVLYLCEKAS